LDVVVGAWLHLKPILLDVWDDRLVLYLDDICLFGSFTSWLFFFLSLFSLLRLEFEVAEEVEVRVLRLTAGRKNELLTDDFLDLIGWDSNLVVECQRYTEKRLTSTLRWGWLSHCLIEIHRHNLLHVAVFIQGLQPVYQVFN
jgi:hypothetical protein